MPTALILSGTGRYADPWHPFPKTTPLLRKLARDAGWESRVSEDIDRNLAAGLDGVDLVIVNAGDPWRKADESGASHPDPPDHGLIEAARAALDAAFARGVSVLGIHCAASSLRDYPQFREALGGEWVPGLSWHPPFGEVRVRCLHDQVVECLSDFTVSDERYTDLVIDKGVEPLSDSSDGERHHILAWAHQYGPSRVVYDALGHDTRSYDSCGHKSFLRRVMTWLLPRTDFPD